MTGVDNASSIRTDGDSWDITESVGATALSVAAARAVETGATDPLIRDQFAYLLVSTAGQPWARLASSMNWVAFCDSSLNSTPRWLASTPTG